jgi:hypothetical protein
VSLVQDVTKRPGGKFRAVRLGFAVSLAALAALALLAGCGGSASSNASGAATPQAAAAGLIKAIGGGDAQAACKLLSERGKAQLGVTGDCPAKLASSLGGLARGLFTQVSVGRVTVTGRRAVAIVLPAPGSAVTVTKDALDLSQAGGRWFVDGGRASTDAERGGKTAREINDCLKANGRIIPSIANGGDPTQLELGFDTFIFVYHLPEEAQRAFAAKAAGGAPLLKLSSVERNVIVTSTRPVEPDFRRRIAVCI